MDLKVVFPSDRISIRKHVITALVTDQFQHGHELVNSLAVYHTLITLLRIKIELPCHGIYNAAGKKIVLPRSTDSTLLPASPRITSARVVLGAGAPGVVSPAPGVPVEGVLA